MNTTCCKFRCVSKEPAWKDSKDTFKVRFETQYDNTIPEDQAFTKYTPSGHMEATISNPAALSTIEVGQSFYVYIAPIKATD